MPRVKNADEIRILLVTSKMFDIRDKRMAMEDEIFRMANDMRFIRAKRLTRATDLAAYERKLRVRRGNLNGPLSSGQRNLMKMFVDELK